MMTCLAIAFVCFSAGVVIGFFVQAFLSIDGRRDPYERGDESELP